MPRVVFLLLIALQNPLFSYHQIVVPEFGPPEVMQWQEVEQLPEPGPGQVRIRVLATTASFTDTMLRKGIYPGQPEAPMTPGYDVVGVIDKLGEGSTRLTVGQRVADLTVWGAYSEYMLLPAAELVTVPDGLSSENAVSLILAYMTAYQMLHRAAQVEPGQRILIHGASGSVGTALGQLGRLHGLEMYGTASAAKHDHVRAQGVTPIDYRTEDFVLRIQELTDGKGVDAAFDAIGLENFKRSYSSLSPGGKLVIYGFYEESLRSQGSVSWDAAQDFLGTLAMALYWNYWPGSHATAQWYGIPDVREEHPDWFREDLSTLFQLALDGKIRPHIHKRMPLREAVEAHRMIEHGEVKGKIVLIASDS